MTAALVALGGGSARAAGIPAQLNISHAGTACASTGTTHNLPSGMSQTGIAFDGSQLLISCWGDATITAVSPSDGHEIAVHHVVGVGFNARAYGALAYDRADGTLWACASTNNAGTGSPENLMSEVGIINLTLDTYTPVFNSPGCDNGLAWDPGTAPGRQDTLWTSADTATTIFNWTLPLGSSNGSKDVKSLLGTNPGNSGIAIGGGQFFLANPKTTTKRIYRVPADFSSSTLLLSSTHRYEDMECDDQTYSQTVIWIMWFNQNILKPLPIQGTCDSAPPPPPALHIVQTSNGPVQAGQQLTFTDTVSNSGTSPETNVSLSETMPTNASFVSANPSAGSCTPGTPLTCSLGDIGPGDSVTVDVTFDTYGPGTVSSPASASSDQTSQVSDSQPATVTAVPGVTYVTVNDSAITPSTPAPPLGNSTRFVFGGTTAHSIADNTGLGLFDSGPVDPPGAFDFTFTAAGAYKVLDSTTGHTATVQVPTANPDTGSVGVAFDVPWATQSPPPGWVEDVQVLNPGTTTWTNFASGSAATDKMFTPTKTGTYKFRGRLRNTNTGASSAFGTGNSTKVS